MKKIYITIGVALFTSFLTLSCSSSTGTSGTAKNDKISLSGSAIEKKLGTTSTATVKVKALNFDGVVGLALDRTVLDSKFQADDDIVLSLSDAQVTTTTGATAEVTLNINVKTHAPSFKSIDNGGDGKITITATLSSGEKLKLDVPFQVDALYEVRLTVDPMTGIHDWGRPLIESFRHHDGDLTFTFINMDDLSIHEVHANGAIDHEVGAMAMAASPGEEGGKYVAIVDQTQNSATYYCHTHNDTAHTYTVNFNE